MLLVLSIRQASKIVKCYVQHSGSHSLFAKVKVYGFPVTMS